MWELLTTSDCHQYCPGCHQYDNSQYNTYIYNSYWMQKCIHCKTYSKHPSVYLHQVQVPEAKHLKTKREEIEMSMQSVHSSAGSNAKVCVHVHVLLHVREKRNRLKKNQKESCSFLQLLLQSWLTMLRVPLLLFHMVQGKHSQFAYNLKCGILQHKFFMQQE